ncbi:MAG TPA: PAS domain-containing protein [Thermoleophilia bacterium]|nr:PAS domain-containing protein [Thermoleophilia bacterium]
MPVKTPIPNWLEPHLATCEAIVALFHPFAEVAVHDVRRDRIVGIWNPISERKVGDRSYIDELPPHSEDDRVIGPYPKVLADGRQVTSVSVVLHNAKGVARGLLCVNLDRSPFDGMIDVLVRFAAPVEDRPAELFDKDWREQIALVVDEECRTRHLRRDRLTRPHRLELVRVLDDRGLFATRNAAAHAGRALGVSRTTVYALLKEART